MEFRYGWLIIIILLFLQIEYYCQPLGKAEDNYVIGKGDILKIQFIRPQYKELLVTVSNDGYIESKIFSRTKAEGLTVSELKLNILKDLNERFIKPEITVKILISQKIEQNKFYNDFKSNLLIAEEYFNSMKYEESIQSLRAAIDLIMNKLKQLYPDKYGDKILFLQLRKVNYFFQGQNPYRIYIVEGEVVNHTDNSYNWVKLKINFLNKDKKIVNIVERYIISDEVIKPMEARKFEIKGALNSEAEDINYAIVDYILVESKKQESVDVKKSQSK